MRGTGSNHTLVMINGIPINDQSTTQGLHDFGVDFIQFNKSRYAQAQVQHILGQMP